MEQFAKKKTIATTVVSTMVAIMFFVNLILTFEIWLVVDKNLTEAENKYMSEVMTRVSLEIQNEMAQYISIAEGISQSYILHSFLTTVQDETEQGHDDVFDADNVDGYTDAMNELKIVADMFGNTVKRVAICSLYKDNFLTHTGERGGADFSLTSLPYYEAVTSKSLYISDPYDDMFSDVKIIAIAQPMFSKTGDVIGMITIEITTDQVAKIAASTHFGDSGMTYILDRNKDILVYTDPSYLGKSHTAFHYEGADMEREILNPTGTIVEYTKNGVYRTGGAVTTHDALGWTVISSIDSSEFDKKIENVIFTLVISLFIGMFITATACTLSVLKSLAPMSQLEDAMADIANGQLDTQIEYDVPNEIGRLAQHMNQSTRALSTYIADIDRTMKAFEQGNFTYQSNITYAGDFQSIDDSMKRFVEMMSLSLMELNQTIKEVNIGASQLSDGASSLSSGASEQANSVAGLTHLITSINDTIVETAKNSSSVTSDAKQISDDLVHSNIKMQELAVSVQDIRAMSDEVKRIIKSIEEVAFQTNILSLNASVEAARAGSSGRGFAVVADEVRNLSIKTAEAAEETSKIIGSIADAIEAGTDLALTTSKELQGVVDDVDVFVHKISTISLSAQDQAHAIGEINQGITEISNVVTKNSAISEESAASSEELSSQSDTMLSLVEQFKLK